MSYDFSKTVLKYGKNPELLKGLSVGEIDRLKLQLADYEPKSTHGQEYKEKIAKELTRLSLAIAPKRQFSVKAAEQVLDKHTVAEIGKHIAANSVVVEVHVSQPWFKKRIKSDTFLTISGNEGDCDSDYLHVSQDLLDRRMLTKFVTLRIALADNLRSISVPGGILSMANGQYLIPLEMIDTAVQMIDDFRRERERLIDRFEENYSRLVDEAREARGAFFDQADYPPFADIRAKYTLDYKFIGNNVPEELAKVSKQIYEAEKAKIEAQCQAAVFDIRMALREGFSELVGHMVDRLRPDDEGKRKVFHQSRVTNLLEFVDKFQKMNLSEDEQLAELCEQAKMVLSNVDISQIREDETIRGNLLADFESLKAVADSMLVDKRARAVAFDE